MMLEIVKCPCYVGGTSDTGRPHAECPTQLLGGFCEAPWELLDNAWAASATSPVRLKAPLTL